MAWTTPSTRATLYVVTATTWNNEVVGNTKVLRDHASAMRSGTGFTTPIPAYGSDVTLTTSPFVCDYVLGDDNGTPQMRIVGAYNITAVGACTSLALTMKATILLATGNTGQTGTVKSLYAATTLTTGGGTLTTGYKTFDSGYVSLSALTTDLSGYGVMILDPVCRFDTAGGSPTITNFGTLYEPRIL